MAVTDKARNEKILKRITKLHKFCGAFFFCKTFCVYKLYNFSKTPRKNYSSLDWSYRRRNLQKNLVFTLADGYATMGTGHKQFA